MVLPHGAAEEALAAVTRVGAVVLAGGSVAADGTRQVRGRRPCPGARCLAAAGHAHAAHDGYAHIPYSAQRCPAWRKEEKLWNFVFFSCGSDS